VFAIQNLYVQAKKETDAWTTKAQNNNSSIYTVNFEKKCFQWKHPVS
jgi:uncharacterized membrane protein